MQDLELKMQGGLMREGGRNRGILRYMYSKVVIIHTHAHTHTCSHYPTTRFTAVADTPENRRLAQQSKNQSEVSGWIAGCSLHVLCVHWH